MHTKIDYINLTKNIILKYLPTNEYRVFLFGSRAVGNAKDKSDIDVGIWGKKKFPIKTKLLIEDALEESIVPYKVDLVDFFMVDGTFKKYALQKTIEWA